MNPAPPTFWQFSKAVPILSLFCKVTEVVRAWDVSGWVWSSAGCRLGWVGKNCWWTYPINKTGPFYIMRDLQRMKKFCLLAWVRGVHKPPGWLFFLGSVTSKLCQTSRTWETLENFTKAKNFWDFLTGPSRGPESSDNVMVLVNSASHCSEEPHEVHKLVGHQDKTG